MIFDNLTVKGTFQFYYGDGHAKTVTACLYYILSV